MWPCLADDYLPPRQRIVPGRRKPSGCPYCAATNKRPSREFNLMVKYPTLASQWHPTKNKTLKPTDFVPQSHKKVWWKCLNGHSYQAVIYNRVKGWGCSYCGKKKILRENSLVFLYPAIARSWHSTKNGRLTPSKVFPHSKKKAWWICKNGHVWRAAICSRVLGTGCPMCWAQRGIGKKE